MPITKDTKLTERKVNRLCKNLNKKLYKFGIKNIVFSTYLIKVGLIKNRLISTGIDVLNGRILFGYLVYDVICYIVSQGERNIADLEISILANSNTSVATENIKMISTEVKRINILTDNISQFQRLQDYLYEESGIMIKISNNKRKGLSKTNIIINVDFPNELINKYRISDDCVIVNLNENITIDAKRFNGICANGYKILIPEKYKIFGFDDEIIYESLIYDYSIDYGKAREKIKKDSIEIDGLIGNNGEISKEEYKILKNLDKMRIVE